MSSFDSQQDCIPKKEGEFIGSFLYWTFHVLNNKGMETIFLLISAHCFFP